METETVLEQAKQADADLLVAKHWGGVRGWRGWGLQDRCIVQSNLQMHVHGGRGMCKLVSLWLHPYHPIPTWSGSKMLLQHSANCFNPPLCPSFALCWLPRRPALSHVCSQLRLQCTREGTFRHMDLPFVYHQLDKGVTDWSRDLPLSGCGSSTTIWLVLTWREVFFVCVCRGGFTVWNLETRDCCWNSAFKGPEKAWARTVATMTFLKWSKG